jgi:hypothetical protein
MGEELLGLDKWLRSRLTGDATLTGLIGARIFEGFAPDKDPATNVPPVYPLIVFSVLSARDVNGIGGARIMTVPLLLVKVIGKGGGYNGIQPILRRIDTLLQAPDPASVTIDGVSYTILGAVRERPIKYPAALNGERYNHLGGEYRCFVQQ